MFILIFFSFSLENGGRGRVANKDENKLNYNSIERKISGVLNIFKLEC